MHRTAGLCLTTLWARTEGPQTSLAPSPAVAELPTQPLTRVHRAGREPRASAVHPAPFFRTQRVTTAETGTTATELSKGVPMPQAPACLEFLFNLSPCHIFGHFRPNNVCLEKRDGQGLSFQQRLTQRNRKTRGGKGGSARLSQAPHRATRRLHRPSNRDQRVKGTKVQHRQKHQDKPNSDSQCTDQFSKAGAEPKRGTGSAGAAPLPTPVTNSGRKTSAKASGCWVPARAGRPGSGCSDMLLEGGGTRAQRESASEAKLRGRNAALRC